MDLVRPYDLESDNASSNSNRDLEVKMNLSKMKIKLITVHEIPIKL